MKGSAYKTRRERTPEEQEALVQDFIKTFSAFEIQPKKEPVVYENLGLWNQEGVDGEKL